MYQQDLPKLRINDASYPELTYFTNNEIGMLITANKMRMYNSS